MKLSLLSERREWIHLFHGTAIKNIKSILKNGLDRGESDRTYLGLSPELAYGGSYQEHEQDGAFALIEIMTTKQHHEMNAYSTRKTVPGTPQGDRVKHFDDKYDREELLSNPDLEKERRQYHAALSRYTRTHGTPDDAKEVDFPLTIGFSGNPKIVAIYVVSLPDNIVSRIEYGVSGISFKVGDKLPD